MNSDVIRDVFMSLCEDVNTPRSLAASILFREGEYEQLVSLVVDPLQYRHDLISTSGLETFRNDYLVSEFLSKYKGFVIKGVDKEEVAMSEFFRCEGVCRETNLRLRAAREFGFPPNVASVIFGAQRKISKLLYDVGRSFDLSLLFEESQFGPGATFGLPKRTAYTENKVKDLSVSFRALKYMNLDLHTSKLWNDVLKSAGISDIDYNSTNRVTTVPKNAKRNRTIGVEPTYSMFYQKSIGNWLRSQLSFVKVFLQDQSFNQDLARKGSFSGSLATVDLRSASDSIALETIYELFPVDFASVLDDLRSSHYEVSGKRYRYEKFSSMGNGFTFEVESAIFWALTTSVIDIVSPKDRRFAIYGDDIIVSVECISLLSEVLAFFGFEMNQKKTHTSGPFRESCGKHFFFGVDVSPIYQKEKPDVLEEAYRLANRIRRLAFDRLARTNSDGILYRAWTAAVANVRLLERALYVRFEVPLDSELDGGLALPLSEMRGYAYLRFKHGDKLIAKKVRSPSVSNSICRYYIYSEKRATRKRSFETIVPVMRSRHYSPELPYESSRLKGRFGPSRVVHSDPVVVNAGWVY